MTPDMVRYHIMAITAQNASAVRHTVQPKSPVSLITVYDEGNEPNVHNSVTIARYQAIVRNKDHGECERLATLIFEAEYESNSLSTYYGMYLAADMAGTGTIVTFAPDNGSGTSTAARFSVNDYILIGSEVLKVTNVSGSNVTASRAQLGTTIAAHTDNDAIHNITKNPIPGKQCDSTYIEGIGMADLGVDKNDAHEISVNWTVRLKR